MKQTMIIEMRNSGQSAFRRLMQENVPENVFSPMIEACRNAPQNGQYYRIENDRLKKSRLLSGMSIQCRGHLLLFLMLLAMTSSSNMHNGHDFSVALLRLVIIRFYLYIIFYTFACSREMCLLQSFLRRSHNCNLALQIAYR